MKVRKWGSEIETAIDDTSFTIFTTSQGKGYSPVIILLVFAIVPFSLIFMAVWYGVIYEVYIYLWMFLYLSGLVLIKMMLKFFPVGGDSFLYFVDNKVRYKFHSWGYKEVEHSISDINKVAVSPDNDFLILHLYDSRVVQVIDIPLSYRSEALQLLNMTRNFLAKQRMKIKDK